MTLQDIMLFDNIFHSRTRKVSYSCSTVSKKINKINSNKTKNIKYMISNKMISFFCLTWPNDIYKKITIYGKNETYLVRYSLHFRSQKITVKFFSLHQLFITQKHFYFSKKFNNMKEIV